MQTNFFHALTESFLKSRQYLRKLFYGQTREIQELEFFSADLGISHGHRLSPSVAFSSVYHNRNKVYLSGQLWGETMTEKQYPNLHIFISHSSKNNDFGFQLVKDLGYFLGNDSYIWYDSKGGLRGG